MTSRLEALHALWMRESGLTLPKWSFGIMHRWELLAVECDRAGMDMPLEQALPIVIARIKREGRKFYGFYQHLSFYRLTKSEVFIEHLSAALAERRKPKPQAPIVRQDWRKPQPQEPPAKKVDEILNSDAFKAFVKLRDEL